MRVGLRFRRAQPSFAARERAVLLVVVLRLRAFRRRGLMSKAPVVGIAIFRPFIRGWGVEIFSLSCRERPYVPTLRW